MANSSAVMRKMASELKILPGSLRTIVKETWVYLLLRESRFISFLNQFGRRGSRIQRAYYRYATVGLDKVVFSDEKLFTIEEALNKQNDRILSRSIYAIPEEHRLVKRVQKPISAEGQTPLISSLLVQKPMHLYTTLYTTSRKWLLSLPVPLILWGIICLLFPL